jgi:hypothetical protein
MSRLPARYSGWFETLQAFLRRSLPSARRVQPPRPCSRRPRVDPLEDRVVPAGSWTTLAASGTGPANGGAMMMLLSDGSVLVQNGINPTTSAAQNTYRLLPQANTGSYVNGSWSATAGNTLPTATPPRSSTPRATAASGPGPARTRPKPPSSVTTRSKCCPPGPTRARSSRGILTAVRRTASTPRPPPEASGYRRPGPSCTRQVGGRQ